MYTHCVHLSNTSTITLNNKLQETHVISSKKTIPSLHPHSPTFLGGDSLGDSSMTDGVRGAPQVGVSGVGGGAASRGGDVTALMPRMAVKATPLAKLGSLFTCYVARFFFAKEFFNESWEGEQGGVTKWGPGLWIDQGFREENCKVGLYYSRIGWLL